MWCCFCKLNACCGQKVGGDPTGLWICDQGILDRNPTHVRRNQLVRVETRKHHIQKYTRLGILSRYDGKLADALKLLVTFLDFVSIAFWDAFSVLFVEIVFLIVHEICDRNKFTNKILVLC